MTSPQSSPREDDSQEVPLQRTIHVCYQLHSSKTEIHRLEKKQREDWLQVSSG